MAFFLTSNLHLFASFFCTRAAPGAKSRRISQTALSIPEHLRAYGGISKYPHAYLSICEHRWASESISGRIESRHTGGRRVAEPAY